VLQNGSRQGLVFGHPDDGHGVSPIHERLRRLGEGLEGPGPDGQDSPAGVQQHQLLAFHGGEVAVQSFLHRLLFAFPQAHGGGCLRDAVVGLELVLRHRARVDGIDEGQELVADVAVGVVQDGPVDEVSPV